MSAIKWMYSAVLLCMSTITDMKKCFLTGESLSFIVKMKAMRQNVY